MERRIRVKCPECEAPIELKVDQERLVDVHCPRCRNEFTARVPEPVIEPVAAPLAQVASERSMTAAEPVVRPKRVKTIPKKSPKPEYDPLSNLDAPEAGRGYGYPYGNYGGSAYTPPTASSAFNGRAFVIALASMLSIGLLIGFGYLLTTIISRASQSLGSMVAVNSTESQGTAAQPSAASPQAASSTSPSSTPGSSQAFSTQPTSAPASSPSPATSVSPFGGPGGSSQPMSSPVPNSSTPTNATPSPSPKYPSSLPMSAGPELAIGDASPTGGSGGGSTPAFGGAPRPSSPSFSQPSGSSGSTTFNQPTSDLSGDYNGMVNRVVEQARVLGRATIAGDYEFIADQTYHGLMTRMGGRAGLVSATRKAFDAMKSSGTVIHNYEVDQNVTIKRNHSKVFAVVPITSEMSVQQRRVRTNSYLLAISEDDGKTFSFLDGNGLKDEQARRSIVPDLPPDLTLPASAAIVGQ